MIWLPKYYASSVGVPCCHCRMDNSFFKKALRFHTKKNQDKFFMPDYGRLECVTLSNHLYSHSSRSVPSISYM